jgi:hypothetical protein
MPSRPFDRAHQELERKILDIQFLHGICVAADDPSLKGD